MSIEYYERVRFGSIIKSSEKFKPYADTIYGKKKSEERKRLYDEIDRRKLGYEV